MTAQTQVDAIVQAYELKDAKNPAGIAYALVQMWYYHYPVKEVRDFDIATLTLKLYMAVRRFVVANWRTDVQGRVLNNIKGTCCAAPEAQGRCNSGSQDESYDGQHENIR
jgi:hypothetical protein